MLASLSQARFSGEPKVDALQGYFDPGGMMPFMRRYSTIWP
jgi:hypothetical protein